MENPTHEFGDYQTHLMEPEVLITCKAVMSQGKKKGKQCWRPPGESGYCGKHKTASAIKTAESVGFHKCSTHRCTTMLAVGVKYCVDCAHKKDESIRSKTLCRGKITQGANKGSLCDKEASTPEGFCGKHTLNVLVEKAAEDGHRICDDGKRVCKNYTSDSRSKCEECLEVIRTKERADHAALRESGKCLGCGQEIITQTIGVRKDNVQRCEQCYAKMREVEDGRDRQRNYKQERKMNIHTHYQNYIKSAAMRNKQFELSIDEFSELVNSRCNYCDSYDETEVIGIDRVDNTSGYTEGNVVPCCAKCNMMKNDMNVDEFVTHIQKICEHISDKVNRRPSESGTCAGAGSATPSISSYIPPKKIMEKYRSGKLDDYIANCVTDGRSPTFIDKMRELRSSTLNDVDTRAFIKSSLWAETVQKTLGDRQRINKKEMYGYLKVGNIDACVDHYSRVHGIPEGFRADMESLMDDLTEKEFTRILVKYQNRRNS
jgi:hypothetical protein